MLSVREFGRETDLSEAQVRALIAAGEIDAERFGNNWAIPVEELDRFLGDDAEVNEADDSDDQE